MVQIHTTSGSLFFLQERSLTKYATHLFSRRPEQHISLAFNAGLLWELSTRIALNESYIPDDDIRLVLGDKFKEIKSTHCLRAYIPLK